MIKINCAEKIKEICNHLESEFDSGLFLIERECFDSWDENGACFAVNLMEENYRDYPLLSRDIIDKIANLLEHGVTILSDDFYPKEGYVFRIYFQGDLHIHFELHKVKDGKPIHSK